MPVTRMTRPGAGRKIAQVRRAARRLLYAPQAIMGTRAPFAAAFVVAAGVTCILQGCTTDTVVEKVAAPADDPGAPSPDAAPQPAPPEPDAGPAVDNGAPSNVFPAPHSSARRLEKLPGPVLPLPVIIPVFFGDDAERARTETLLQQLPGSAYWKQLAEYGVGNVTIGASVVIADVAPATYSLEAIDTKVSALWTRATNPAPAPDGTQIYAVFLPTQTTLLQVDGSPFCSAGGAYHDSKGTSFAYAITPHCSQSFDEFALSATHELIEAATDPYPLVTPAWAGADLAHIGDRGEVGDLCDYGGKIGGGGGIAMFGTTVERVFSNVRAAAGHDPCIPDLGVPYFGAAPVVSDDVRVNDFVLGDLPAKGALVKVGDSKTITVELFSDRKVAPWNVAVQTVDLATFGPSTNITASLDRAKGENGEKLHLTVTRTAASQLGDKIQLVSTSSEAVWTDSLFVGQ